MWCFDRLSTNGWEMLSTNGWETIAAHQSSVILNEVKDLSFGIRKGFAKHRSRVPSEAEQRTRFFAEFTLSAQSRCFASLSMTAEGLRMTMLSALRMTR
jgi:hypothetical protein